MNTLPGKEEVWVILGMTMTKAEKRRNELRTSRTTKYRLMKSKLTAKDRSCSIKYP